MTTVYWDYYRPFKANWLGLLLIEPTPALFEIAKSRTPTSDNHFLKCPAFIGYYKNTYVIKSPVDIELRYDNATRRLQVYPQEQEFFDANVTYRGNDIDIKDPFLMSIFLGYLFIADKDCTVELIPAFMHDSEFISKTRIVCGYFNISRWYRPIELSFEFKNQSDVIKIKRDDPLAYVRFISDDDEKVTLTRKEFSEEALDAVATCLLTKKSLGKGSMKFLYKVTEQLRNKLNLKPKCPFNWRNK
jgi:hypothetical protein